MVDKTPVRVVFDSDNVATGLGEFQTGETVPLANGGTGAALTIGQAGQVFRVNPAGTAMEFADQGDIDVIASSDSTGVQVQDDLNISGTLSVNHLDVNEMQSVDSTGITIKDDLLLQGTLRAEDSSIISIDGSVASSGSITSGSSFIIGSADLNETDMEKLDGITDGTVAANKAVVVDSNLDIGSFRNVTATGSFIIGSADMNETDLEKLDGITNGTVAASKAVVVDASKDIGTFGTITGSALVIESISSADSTSLLISDGLTLAGPIKSDASTGINIEENLSVRGNITILGTPSDDTDATTVSYVTDNFGKSGFPNSSLTTYPTSSDSSATDYHEGSDGIGDFTSADAFNVALINNYDCMEPIGSTTTTDFGSSESHVGG
mgnify:CR=1 FL=1